MPAETLWSDDDQAHLVELRRALPRDDLAGALLAVEGAPPDRAAAAMEALDAWSLQVRDRCDGALGAAEQAHALAEVLGAAGFRGDRDDYHAPTNSFLTRVVERRRGLPILLSAVWMLVGHGAGIHVQGVGLPGHFIARVGGDGGSLVDPFAGGDILSLVDCQRLISRVSGGKLSWRDDFLRPVTTRELIERTLRNLINAYTLARDSVRVYRVIQLWCGLCPSDAEPHLLRALQAERLGASLLAIEAYTDLLARFGQTLEARQAEAGLARLQRRGGAN